MRLVDSINKNVYYGVCVCVLVLAVPTNKCTPFAYFEVVDKVDFGGMMTITIAVRKDASFGRLGRL